MDHSKRICTSAELGILHSIMRDCVDAELPSDLPDNFNDLSPRLQFIWNMYCYLSNEDVVIVWGHEIQQRR